MDVPRQRFQESLPFILEDIVNAHFVSLDLEFSGIAGGQLNRPRTNGKASGGKQTLQERYADIKNAVERYQCLQLGLTCVMEDRKSRNYILKPYNFFLNPVPDDRLHVERIFAYQSSAVKFLLEHKFRMEAPFLEGVPYFSREEEAIAKRAHSEKSIYSDIDIDPEDIESLIFVKGVTEEIEAWKATRGPKDTYLNISTAETGDSQASDRGLNKFQKALVHQIVRKHPELVAISRQSFIQIIDYDEERESQHKARKLQYFEHDLTRQIGLRWAVEAMVRGDLTGLDPSIFLPFMEGQQEDVIQWVINLKASLKEKSTVLIGHNIFTDLMYFHKCFFGNLPDKVEDFQRVIHELFPLVIDTKYLATHNRNNPSMANSSLEQLKADLDVLRFEKTPIVRVHEDHNNYLSKAAAHEAGFDSYLTAEVLIRLSTKLEAAGMYVDGPLSPPDPVVRSVPPLDATLDSTLAIASDEDYFTPEQGVLIDRSHDISKRASDSSSGGVPLVKNLTLYENTPPLMTPRTQKKATNRVRLSKSEQKTDGFAHVGMFDALSDLPSNMDGSAESLEGEVGPPHVMMPPFESHFWEVYGNKLRVNGTVEGVCHLAEPNKYGW